MPKLNEMRESPRGRSMLNLYKQCPKRWAFKYLKGFTPPNNSNPLILGSAIHEAQALFYQGGHIVEVFKYLEELLKDSPWLIAKAHDMLATWYNKIGAKDKELKVPLAVEIEAPLTLPNGFQMSVRWDRVLLDKEDGEIAIIDTKTTSGGVNQVLQSYNYSDQPKLYIASINQSHEEWAKQLRGWRTDAIYGRELKSGKINTEAVRSELVTFSDGEIEDTLVSYASVTDDIAYKLEALEAEEPISQHFYNNSDFCYSYGRVCPFKPICHQIDKLSNPPADMTIDPWLKEGIIKDAFKDLLKN